MILIIGLILILYSFIYLFNIYNKYIIKNISKHQIIIGHEKYKRPIIIDFNSSPHLLISGLSKQGKSKMAEYIVQNKNCILINTFSKDFKSLKNYRRVNGEDNIYKYFNNLINDLYCRNEPLYLLIDELLSLCINSKLESIIMRLLAYGRHYNIYIIGITLSGTKEVVKFKDLFCNRVSFLQIDDAAYRVVLGYSPENKDLKHRQFYYISSKKGFGYTYNI